ncbi:ATP-binding protein [Paenibacillus sp. NPDC093718]|uniref:ATP-binding protein n=1 Tax=Paenibacillus sp. NPDC093718 TaxID=3390601 RepID=UPI003CFE7E7B
MVFIHFIFLSPKQQYTNHVQVTGGAGLGLSIAHQFVRAHDGFIRVESQLNKGTIFTVYLPI